MGTPYRDNAKPAGDPLRKYMRLKARARGLWRRVVGPTTLICVFGTLWGACNAIMQDDNKRSAQSADAANRRHFDDWQAMIDKNQAAMTTRQAEMDKREAELSSRVRNFEDLISMAPMLIKNDGNSDLKDALKRVKQPNKKD